MADEARFVFFVQGHAPPCGLNSKGKSGCPADHEVQFMLPTELAALTSRSSLLDYRYPADWGIPRINFKSRQKAGYASTY
jgi:hypothetical protein